MRALHAYIVQALAVTLVIAALATTHGTTPPARAGSPDLVIDYITLDPSNPVEGQTVTVTVGITNAGESSAGQVWVEFYAHLTSPPSVTQQGDDSCLSDPLGFPFPNSSQCTGSITYPDAGNFTLWVLLDRDNQAFESNENNNTGSYFVQVYTDSDGDFIGDPLDNCPAWPNPAQALPPWPVPAGDSDCDGFSDAAEGTLGTVATQQCPVAGNPDAWPPDFNKSGSVSVTDVLAMKPHFGLAVPPAPVRFDLVPSGSVSVSDVLELKPYFNKGCS